MLDDKLPIMLQHFNCRCVLIPKITFAEALLELAYAIQHPPDLLVSMAGLKDMPLMKEWLARCALAIDFASRLRKADHFRAIFEEWDQQRILQELY